METGHIIYSVLLIMIVGSALVNRSTSMSANVKMAAIWVVIFAVIIAAATYWGDISNSKFAGKLVPGNANINEDGSMEFYRSSDGHFYINTNVNSNRVRFMLDTGASDIVLSMQDAKDIGIDVESLGFDRVYNTANGQTTGATVNLRVFQIGDVVFNDITASVNKGEMSGSLLGMSFLNNMRSYKFEGDKLIIHP